MTPETPAPRYERYRLTYPSGTVIDAFYADGATLEEVQLTHPLAEAEGEDGGNGAGRREAVEP